MVIQEAEPILRIAYRVEGEFWNAYVAKVDTMHDATLIGSIRMILVADPKHEKAFKDLMWNCFADIIEAAYGLRPLDPIEQPAPEHERTKE